MSADRLRLGFTAAGLVLIGALLAGCGKKGPLYLPREGTPPAQAPAPETQDKEKTRH